jgi:tetratricopeptide (TPR) repeat protein
MQEGLYLQALAEIYTASLQPNNAADIKQRLVDSYLASQKIEFVPPLKVDIGQAYEALDKPELASQNYQEAYALAWSLQLFGAAAEALTRLANLYKNYEQEDYALQIYQRLIQVEQLSYNYYGLMRVYDKIGEIYLERKQYQPALEAFQQGFILARSLNYKQDHFLSQIQRVNQGIQEKEIPNLEEDFAPTPNNIDTLQR